MSGSKLPNSVMAFVVGLGMGALVGILFAPKSGEETREYLMGGAKNAIESVTTTGQKITRTAKQAVNDAAERVMNATEEGERAFTKARGA